MIILRKSFYTNKLQSEINAKVKDNKVEKRVLETRTQRKRLEKQKQ